MVRSNKIHVGAEHRVTQTPFPINSQLTTTKTQLKAAQRNWKAPNSNISKFLHFCIAVKSLLIFKHLFKSHYQLNQLDF